MKIIDRFDEVNKPFIIIQMEKSNRLQKKIVDHEIEKLKIKE